MDNKHKEGTFRDKLSQLRSKLKHIDKWNIAAFAVWTYLVVRFESVRNFILGMLRAVVQFWGTTLAFVIALSIVAVVAFVIVQIGLKTGLIKQDFMDKLREMRLRNEGNTINKN